MNIPWDNCEELIQLVLNGTLCKDDFQKEILELEYDLEFEEDPKIIKEMEKQKGKITELMNTLHFTNQTKKIFDLSIFSEQIKKKKELIKEIGQSISKLTGDEKKEKILLLRSEKEKLAVMSKQYESIVVRKGSSNKTVEELNKIFELV